MFRFMTSIGEESISCHYTKCKNSLVKEYKWNHSKEEDGKECQKAFSLSWW